MYTVLFKPSSPMIIYLKYVNINNFQIFDKHVEKKKEKITLLLIPTN